jgi:acyl dehydratase
MNRLLPLSDVPGVGGVIPRAFLTLLKKPGDALPDLGYKIQGVGIDSGPYKAFCRMFGFSEESVPLTYWHIRFFGLRAFLASRPEAPFPLPGMVHLSDRIRQYRPVRPDESFTVECRFGHLMAHEKGTAFETLTQLFSGDELVWEENTVNLYLGKKIPCPSEAESTPIELSQNCSSVPVALGADLGRKYAAVSGDYNPIHLNRLGARLFGFHKHLLHGWYSVNSCLQPYEKQLKEKAELQAYFKKPLFLPSKVNMKAELSENDVLFEAADFKEDFPHVKGLLIPGIA